MAPGSSSDGRPDVRSAVLAAAPGAHVARATHLQPSPAPADPPGMYTCCSGFVEHGESAEVAAVREVLEETAVVCEPARLVGSQPWPLGRGHHCELMLGCIARATSPDAEVIDVTTGGGAGGGGELEEARWFGREEVRQMLGRRPGDATALAVPPSFAIAHSLIRRWAEGSLSASRL